MEKWNIRETLSKLAMVVKPYNPLNSNLCLVRFFVTKLQYMCCVLNVNQTGEIVDTLLQ